MSMETKLQICFDEIRYFLIFLVVPKILWKLPQITRWCEKPSPAIQSLVKQTLLTTEPMVFSFAVKGDGIQKEQHKVALGSENFKPLAIRIVKSTLRCLFS